MKIFKFPVMLALALGFVVAMHSNVKADEPVADQFKVMSFNIRLGTGADGDNVWENRKETLIDVIKEDDPLLLGVQEALWFQMEYLDESLECYKWVGIGRDDGKEAGEVMAIFYKEDALELLDSGTFWLSQTPEKPGRGWDAACNRTVTWTKFRCKKSDHEFVFCNTHLDHVGTIARKKGAELLMERAWELTEHGKLPLFVTGDFNVTKDSEAYATVTSGHGDIPGLVDANVVAKERDIAQPYTFHGWGRVPAENGVVIDYVFVNDKVDVEKFKINPVKHSDGRYASDHVSVVATLSFK